MQKQCQVCKIVPQKYRCPKCLMRYCAPQCFKQHRCKPVKPHSQVHSQQQEETIFKSDYVDEDVKLPSQKLEMLRNSKKIRTYLQNSRLRQKLIELDDSKQRMADLNHEIKNNKDFETFVNEMLQEMGVEMQ